MSHQENVPRAKTAKMEAQAKRGGHEMKKIFDVQPRIPSMRRPQTTDPTSFTAYKFGHSNVLTKHDFTTCDKYHARDKEILNQRYVAYPVSVPDISKEAADETAFRRTSHAKFLEEDNKIFRKKFYPECTSDWFHQKHMIRHYLATMHPYSDPLDRGRTYNQSRLKTAERDLSGLPLADFLQPEDPTRPRSTGYSPGHTRTILGLDAYGPHHAEKLRLAREVGELPASPNVDRELAISRVGGAIIESDRPDSPSNTTVSSAPSTAESKTRRHTKKLDTLDDPKQYLPPFMSRSHNYASNNQIVGTPDYTRTLHSGGDMPKDRIAATDHGFEPFPDMTPGEMLTTANKASQVRITTAKFDANIRSETDASILSKTSRGGVKPPGHPKPPHDTTQPGQLGYHGVAVTKDDRLMKDSIGRGVEWFNRRQEHGKQLELARLQSVNERRVRTAVMKDAEAAIIDLSAFDKALEFRRTAKPADLPENNSKRARMKAQGNGGSGNASGAAE